MKDDTYICNLSARALLEAYRTKALSPAEVMSAILNCVEAINPTINALFCCREELATQAANASEARWLKGEPCGPLDGVPVLLKDSVKCVDFDYLHGCKAYEGSPRPLDDAPPAARIKEAGGIIYAKTTMPDFGMLAAGVSSAFGIIRNPWNPLLNPGGSSAGSAAAVAARLAPLAVGTDIAGSVRLPAAHCGLVGLKPSRGRIPYLQPHPLRCAGPMARCADDAGLLMRVLVRPDARDYESLPPCDEQPYAELLQTPPDFLNNKRIGLMLDMGYGLPLDPRISARVSAAATMFEQAGAIVETVPEVVDDCPMAALTLWLQSRAYHEYMSLPQPKQSLVLPYIAQWCQQILTVSAAALSDALFALDAFKIRLNKMLTPYDYVISPVLSDSSFAADQVGIDPADHFAHCAFTIPFNQTGNPAITVCCGFLDDLPVGLQIAGRRYDDLGVFQVAQLYESMRGFAIQWPQVTPQ